MTQENFASVIERMLGLEFVSDPRKARFKIPVTPKKNPADRPCTHPSMVITPQMARDILKYRVIRLDQVPKELKHEEMKGNRRFLLKTLRGTPQRKGLIEVVEREWNPRISTPIVFTWDGFLLDGQHRMAACALSGAPIELPIVTNGQWDTFSVLDTGRGRTGGQLLGDEVPYPDHAASTARLILPVIYGIERSKWTIADATNQEIYDLVHGWPFFHDSWNGSGSWMKHTLQASATGVPQTALAASVMMALAAKANPSHVQEFLNGLRKDYRNGFPWPGKGDDPRFLLRSQYSNKSKKKRPNDRDRRDQVSHVRRAMGTWLDYKEGIRTAHLQKLQAAAENADLPQVWNADAVRKFHAEEIS